jgi:hypothetical protein
MAWRCRFLAARPSQDGRVITEKWLSEELSGAPDTLFDFHTGSCAGTVLSPSFGGGLAWGGGGGGFLPWGGGGLGFLVSPLGGGIGGFSLFGGGTGGFLPGGTGGFFWGGGGRGLASFFGGGGGRGGSLASPLGGGLDAAPVPGDGGASLAAASSFSPDHQLDQEPAAAWAHSSATRRRRSMVVRVRYQTRAAIQTRNVAAWLLWGSPHQATPRFSAKYRS